MGVSICKRRCFQNSIITNLISIVYILCFFKLVSPLVLSYRLQSIKHSKILIFDEKKQNDLLFDQNSKYLNFYVLNNLESPSCDEITYDFIYSKENFIGFEVFDNFLNSNRMENMNMKIECNFNLTYFLRLTNDITNISSKINYQVFDCLLFAMKSLDVIENKNLKLLFQAILFNFIFFNNNGYFNNNGTSFKDPFFSSLLLDIKYTLKKNLIFAYLNNLMIKYIFYDENLILLEKNNETYNKKHFDKHIPYKSLLINSYRAFQILENILNNQNILHMLEFLLNEMNIKSIIFDNFQIFKILDSNMKIYILSMNIFKSITISHFKWSSSWLFLRKHIFSDKKNIEFLSLKNLKISKSDLEVICKKQKFKGLVLHNIKILENTNKNDLFFGLGVRLEYINFKNVEICEGWWKEFFQLVHIRIIIISFYTYSSQEKFIKEFIRVNTLNELLYLELDFCYSSISKDFCNSLHHFKSLITLKLYGYQLDQNTHFFSHAFESMDKLENLTVQSCDFNSDLFNSLFHKRSLKSLHFQSLSAKKEILKIDLLDNYKSLLKLNLWNLKINETSLVEIFKLENLISLSLNFCTFETNRNSNSIYFKSKNLKSLYLNDIDLANIYTPYLFNNLEHLERLDLSFCKLKPSNLIKLNFMCNSTLKIFSFESGVVDSNYIERLRDFEILNALNLSRCKLYKCSFYELGTDCRFFITLEYLNLSHVKTNINDLAYLKFFKNLKNLYISLSDFYLSENFFYVLLPIKKFFKKNLFIETNSTMISKYIYEENPNDGFF
ncbi:hypothetical protein CWI37_0063p0020 [Hamiltosporidium tvaerminnensis]|uniref:Leucine-rich repeat-containing protein n=1 Tax=Hamiltosporidium tvaerminnensis TaxID=1176355 RepID=A0A4Q9LB24_9MICR|nr:hypothetical protein CWI37_0063p0020 [Hamiltosporidium tvaerminnensis]